MQYAGSAFAVEVSRNEKTGVCHATYASQTSCPPCPLKGAGCYAEHGPMGVHTHRINKAAQGATPLQVAEAEAHAIRNTLSGRLDLRLHVVGDCASNEAASLVSEAALETLKPGREAWSYTHAWKNVDRASWGGVSVLASNETTAGVKEAQGKGWATALIVTKFQDTRLYEKDGLKILPCPQQAHPEKKVQCVDCRLCFDDARLAAKGITIGFEAHGSRFKVVGRMLNVLGQ